jgi:hypothetical protein
VVKTPLETCPDAAAARSGDETFTRAHPQVTAIIISNHFRQPISVRMREILRAIVSQSYVGRCYTTSASLVKKRFNSAR